MQPNARIWQLTSKRYVYQNVPVSRAMTIVLLILRKTWKIAHVVDIAEVGFLISGISVMYWRF